MANDKFAQAMEELQVEIASQAKAFVKVYAQAALGSVQSIGGSAASMSGSTTQASGAGAGTSAATQQASGAATQTENQIDTNSGESHTHFNLRSIEDSRNLARKEDAMHTDFRASLNASHQDLARVASTALGFATLGAQFGQGIMMNSMSDHRDQNHNQDRKTGVLDLVVVGDAAEESSNDTDK